MLCCMPAQSRMTETNFIKMPICLVDTDPSNGNLTNLTAF